MITRSLVAGHLIPQKLSGTFEFISLQLLLLLWSMNSICGGDLVDDHQLTNVRLIQLDCCFKVATRAVPDEEDPPQQQQQQMRG